MVYTLKHIYCYSSNGNQTQLPQPTTYIRIEKQLHKLRYAKCLKESGNPGDSESETFMVSDVLCLVWQYYISTHIPQLKLRSPPPHPLTQICISKPVNTARF